MDLGEVIFYILIGIIALLTILWIFKPSPESTNYQKKLKENLQDEYLYDIETGIKITLEEVESGNWEPKNKSLVLMPESEIEKFYTEEAKNAYRTINTLISRANHKEYTLNEIEVDILRATKIFSKYDDWGYQYCFDISNRRGFIIIPEITYYDDDYHEIQLLFWLQLNSNYGHYYFRQKSRTEKIADYFRNDDEISIKNYECFKFKQTNSIFQLLKVIQEFEDQENLEIEILDENLFFKNLQLVNKKDLDRMQLIADRIIKNKY